jgi:hypothetical protein
MLEGKVSYITPQLVYLKFESTDGINPNDTLFQSVDKKYQPKLLVKFVSSISVACEKIYDIELKVGDTYYAIIETKDANKSEGDTSFVLQKNDSLAEQQNNAQIVNVESSSSNISKISGNNFSGKYSIQSYSNIDNFSRNDYQSWRHTFRIDYERIGNSDLSFSTYSIFNYRTSEWSSVKKNYFNALKVYDLHLKYDFSQSFQLWIGRFLHPKISNISTNDGLLVQLNLNSFSFGIVGGSRPDWKDFSFNPKLIEYGTFVSRIDSFSTGYMENTISFFQQNNNSKTDRRFLYLQHSNNAIKKINLFASSEIDLYKRELGVDKNQFSFTSVFLSANYIPIRELSFNLSYDARKNVIYYETFQSLTDSVIENETRQGFRIRTSIKPFKYFGASFFAGYRFRKSDVKPSRNFGGTIYYSLLPIIESGINLSHNKLISNYVDGDVYSVYMTKTFYDLNSDLSIGYRKTNYKFPVSQNSFNENTLLIDYNFNLFRMISLSVSYEGAFESSRTTSRVLVGLTTRF